MTPRIEVYTLKEAAALLKVHWHTLRKWMKAGHVRQARLPKGPRGERAIRIPKSELERLLGV